VNTASILALVAVAMLRLGGPTLAANAPVAAPPEKAAEDESRVSHTTNGEVRITLDAETRGRVELRLAPVVATNLPPEVKGYARVLDPAPLLALWAELEPARVAADASRKEFERLRNLRAQDNASDRALQAAEAIAVRDRLAVESLRARLVLGWGRPIAESAALPAEAASLAELRSALVRIDLPAGEMLPGQPKTARLLPLAAGATPIAAEFVGTATTTDPQFQGRGLLYLVRGSGLTVGAALTGFVLTDGAALSGWLVPAEALIRHAGRNWVWVQTSADTFVRREAVIDRTCGGAYFVTKGFTAGEQVVTVGAQQLLSEELKGQGGEE
jgi:membrane fusion protein, multidrug efflux system